MPEQSVSRVVSHPNLHFKMCYAAFKKSPEYEFSVRLNGGKEKKLRVAAFARHSHIALPAAPKPVTYSGGWASFDSNFTYKVGEVFFIPEPVTLFGLLGIRNADHSFYCVAMVGVMNL